MHEARCFVALLSGDARLLRPVGRCEATYVVTDGTTLLEPATRATGGGMPRAVLISVVEDDQFFGLSMRMLMKSLGYPVEGYSSAADFLASPRLPETTCLISDVQTPVTSGFELH
jgi:hypothetical protein